jgi:hypothetical protein
MDPAISGLHALFANMNVGAGEFDLIEMRAIHEILRRIFKADSRPFRIPAAHFADAESVRGGERNI